jgi:hypothetical protein
METRRGGNMEAERRGGEEKRRGGEGEEAFIMCA